MKKLFLAALLVVGMTTFAQEKRESKEKLTDDQKVELQVKKMKLELDLNDKQTSEMKKIVAEQVKKREAKKAEMEARKAKGVKPTQEEMFQNKSKMLDEQIAMKAELKKVLTPEQFSKWEKNQAEKRENMKERMGKRRHAKR